MFNHEVKRALLVYEIKAQASDQPGGITQVDVKYPLPPEGQQPTRIFGSLFGSSSSQSADSTGGGENDWHAVAGTEHPRELKYWREGWYLWMSKSRWAAQEKMDLMMCDLEKQAEWQKYKEKVTEEWMAYEQGQVGSGPIGVGDSAMEDHSHGMIPAALSQHEKPSVADRHEPSMPGSSQQPFPDSV